MTDSCSTCRFAGDRRNHEDYDCRRHAPLYRKVEHWHDLREYIPQFPVMRSGDWCGDFESRKNSSQALVNVEDLDRRSLFSVLSELLRLYDWRNELGKMEKDPTHDKEQMRKWLLQYGFEKKAVWNSARCVKLDVGTRISETSIK